MLLIMNDRQLQTVERVREFLEGSEAVEFRGLTAQEKYYWIEKVLLSFKYHRLKRGEKGVIRRYIEKVTGYSRSQVSRLIAEYKRTGRLRRMQYRRHRFDLPPKNCTSYNVRKTKPVKRGDSGAKEDLYTGADYQQAARS